MPNFTFQVKEKAATFLYFNRYNFRRRHIEATNSQNESTTGYGGVFEWRLKIVNTNAPFKAMSIFGQFAIFNRVRKKVRIFFSNVHENTPP